MDALAPTARCLLILREASVPLGAGIIVCIEDNLDVVFVIDLLVLTVVVICRISSVESRRRWCWPVAHWLPWGRPRPSARGRDQRLQPTARWLHVAVASRSHEEPQYLSPRCVGQAVRLDAAFRNLTRHGNQKLSCSL